MRSSRGMRERLGRRISEWLLEARSGIEPLYTALQAAASPLCHLAGNGRNLTQERLKLP